MKKQILLFDLDGTLINSSRCILQVYTALFKELGLPVPEGKDFFKFIGPSVRETLKMYMEGDTTPICARFREIYADVDFKATNELYDGITELLERLKEDGYSMYVASTKNQRFARLIVSELGISEYFTEIFGSLDDKSRYNKDDVLNAVFDSGVDKSRCILIGDTKYDYEGAKAVGIPMGAVTYGFGDYDTLKGDGIVWYADSPSQIYERLEKEDE